jgi:hypothetical protein
MGTADGDVIQGADLDALTEAARALMQADNAQLRLGWQHNAYFHGFVATGGSATPARLARQPFTVPCDCWLETVAVRAAGYTAASTLTVSVEAAGILDTFPVEVTGSVGTAVVLPARTLYDGTPGRGGASMASNRAVRKLYAGTQGWISVAGTTSTTAAAFLQVTLAFLQFFAREDT